MTNPTQGLQYLVAFQNNAMDDPNLITTVASPPGTLGGNNVWTDVTRYVTFDSPAPGRGRQHALQQFESGGRQITLFNADGRFTPGNTSGPYTPFVTLRKPFQVRVTWSGTTYTRFTGQVDSWGTSWPDAAQQYSVVHVSDALRMFNLADLTSGGYPAKVLADGAVNYWRMNDLAGNTTLADIGPTPVLGSLTGDPTSTLGNTGALLADPGTSFAPGTGFAFNAYETTWPSTSLTSQTNATLEMWASMTSSEINSSVVVQIPDASGGMCQMWLSSIGTAVQFLGHTTTDTFVSTTNFPLDGKFHHLVVTFGASAIATYIDGVATGSGFTASARAVNGGPNIQGGPATAGNMLLQELAVYNSVLSSGTVSNHYQLAAFPQEGTGSRIGRALNVVGWSSTARAIDTGKSTVQAETGTLVNTSALNHMQEVEATEGGALFMTVDGKVRFYSRTTLQSASFTTANQAVFGDNTGAGDIPFQPAPTLAMDDIDLYNEAVATRNGGIVQIWPRSTSPNTSITNNGRNTWNPPASLIGISDAEVLALCQYAVARYQTPVNRLSSIDIDVVATAASFPSSIPALLLLDLLYQVTVERTIVPGGGATFSQTADIEHITDNIDAANGTWMMSFGMELSDPVWWVLGTAALGQTTELAW